jgi:signal transduction histidine kinase/ligand-binding sensor domain-containing protein
MTNPCITKLPIAMRLMGLMGLIVVAASPAFAQYRFDYWTADTGLPQNSVRAIHQTRDGYLWLATSDGLVRFDGVRFTIFDKSNTPGISSNRFSALHESPDGALWAGTENSGVTRLYQGRFSAYTTERGLSNNFVRGITGDEAGGVWVLSAEQIVRWDNGRFQPAELNGLRVNFENSIWDPSVFLGVDERGVYRFSQGRLTTLPPLPGGLHRRINNRIEEDPSGGFWVGTRDGGVVRVKDGRAIPMDRLHLRHQSRPEGRPAPDGKSAAEKALYTDGQGNRWTIEIEKEMDRTLTLLSSGRLEKIAFFSIFADREGNLWLGTNGRGLYRIRKQAITVYTQSHGLVDHNVYPILEDHTGAIWIGAWQAGISRFKDGKFTNYTVRDGLISSLATSLHEDRDGRLWMGTHNESNGGLYIFKPNGQSTGGSSGRFTVPDQRILPDRTTTSVMYQEPDRTFWFGTVRGLARYRDGVTTMFTTKDGLAGIDVRMIVQRAAGGLWIGCYGGLTQYVAGKFSSFTERDGLASNNVRALYEDRDGVLWIGTYDGGLGRFKDGRFTSYTTRDGLFNNGVFQILEDERGYFWMSSNRGIYRVSKQELNEFAEGKRRAIISIAYGKSDGLLNVECNGGLQPAGIKSRDGKLWFPTQEGVAVIDPAVMTTNPKPPPVLIESCRLDRAPVAFDGEVRIAPGQQNFEVEYTALSFINSEYIRFRYKLEGLDHDWVEAGTRRTAYYPHVPPGGYTFKVIAANSDGVWNTDGKQLRVVVLPQFYQRRRFVVLVALGVAGLAILGYRYRVSQLKRARATQQAFSRQLIASQEAERKRIAAELHDSLGQRLVVIKNLALMYLNSASKNGEGAIGEARRQIEEISAEASQAIGEVKEISYNLRPYQLDRIGLTKAIEAIVRTARSASEIVFTAEIDDIDGVFPKDSEINFYRVVQESVNNILKHSRATEASVTIRRDPGGLRLVIRDNGKGFTPGAAKSDSQAGGFGLIGITERAQLLGGKPVIQSAPGQGTTISIEIVLRPGAL